MFSRFISLVTILSVSLGFLSFSPTPVLAQGVVAADQLSFLQLGQTEITLVGPFDSTTFTFGLPADWKLNNTGKLDLFMTAAFNQTNAGNANAPAVNGGVLTIHVNDKTIAVIPMNQVGDIQYSFPIPPAALVSTRLDGKMKFDITLNSGLSCYLNQQMTLIIQPSSSFTFPHQIVLPDTALANFPQPLYQGSTFQDSAIIVVPDKPSSSELRGAMTIAAGLSNLTGHALNTDLATISELTPEQKNNQHLILVGKSAAVSAFSELVLPAPVIAGKFVGSNLDDGVIQMVNSPWNPAKVVLVASGNTDLGVVKAAQAISTGLIRAGSKPNLALVESVQSVPVNPSLVAHQTFADLGYDNFQFTRRGSTSTSYNFYIPPGTAISADAYLELAYGHSALVDYARSGLVILLNGKPIGSVRMTDTSAGNSVNHLRLSIPSTAVVPGNNLLTISANLMPLDTCSAPNFRGLWAMVWSESNLNLPIGVFPANITALLGLNTYPAPFTFDPTLGTSALLLQHDDPNSWRAALRVAGFLGDRANGSFTTLAVFYNDEIPAAEKPKFNMIVIGRPSKFSLINELNKTLPAPFVNGGDIASEKSTQVAFRLSPSSPVGYVELMPSPWNSDKMILMAVGNSSQGINWAASALVDAPLRSQLKGNFAVIAGLQIVTADTRLGSQLFAPQATPAISDPAASPANPVATVPVQRASWILPALFITFAGIVVIILIAIIGGLRQNRPQTKTKE